MAKALDVEFDGNSGCMLKGRLLVPDEPVSEVPVVLMLTGDGAKGTKSLSWINMPPLLEAHGIASFLFDFHGLGYSAGNRDELTLSIGLANAHAALAQLLELPYVNQGKVSLFGSSFGGNIGILLASEQENIVSVGLKSPVSFYPGSIAHETGLESIQKWISNPSATRESGYKLYADSLYINTYQYARAIKCAVHITHGDADPIVPVEQSVHLRASLQSSIDAHLNIYPGVDHHYSQEGAWDKMAEEFVQFFRRTLG